MGIWANKNTFYFDALKKRGETHADLPGVWVIQYSSAFELISICTVNKKGKKKKVIN